MSLAIVGADHENKRGPTRRFEIAISMPGEVVDLVPEPKNPADPRAIAVYSIRGIQLGYVRAERATLIGSAMREGKLRAIFQQADPWGATVRVSLDGSEPTLPELIDVRRADWPPPGTHDDGWFPDEEWQEA